MSFSPTLIWFLVGMALILVEFAVPGVILVFFGVGAWIVSATTALGVTNSLESQLLLFALASVVLLFALRRWVRSRFLGHKSDEQDPSANLDEFTGQRVLVTKDISPSSIAGRVEYKGAEWEAVADTTIAAGTMVQIVGLDGITLKVQAGEGEEKP